LILADSKKQTAKLEILQSLGGLYDRLEIPLPAPGIITLSLIHTYEHYKRFLLSSFALSFSLFDRDIKYFKIGGGVAPGGGNISKLLYIILIT